MVQFYMHPKVKIYKIIFVGEDFDTNSKFSEYEIIKELGVGGFGKVVLGLHKPTNK